MKLSKNWLNEWVPNQLSTEQLVEQLTMLGLEVDEVLPAGGEFSSVVVAEITACEKHPDADKLKLCQVNNGTEALQIVCGANNARLGLKVPLAQIGAVLPGGFKIKKSKLRGVTSFGMLCSEVELGISQEADGLMELPSDAPLGQSLTDYLQLDDEIIDIDLTPNRADCFSVRGVVREVAAFNYLPFKMPKLATLKEQLSETVTAHLKAQKQCPKYLSRIIKNIDNSAASPIWLKEKLRRSGVKSIHPVVDITNYVMMEIGQPMHAFDLQQIDGDIEVRMGKKGDSLVFLDESEHQLDENYLLIADQKKVLAVAGVMGGLDSSVTAQTQDILLESAYFEPATIMGKARNLGLHTESALRFERGVDTELQAYAMNRATELIVEICGGQVAPIEQAICESELPQSVTISLTEQHLKRVLGFEPKTEQVTEIFNGLGFDCQFSQGQWQVSTPSWRFDLAIAEDLIEEVVRVIGYDQMPAHRLHADDSIRPIPEQIRRQDEIKMQLIDLGYQEVINYSFVAEKQLQDLQQQQHAFPLANPLNQEMSVMRTGLLAGVLANLKANIARQHHDLSLFEMGKVFANDGEQITQNEQLMTVRSGVNVSQQWGQNSNKVDFFDIKGDVERLLEKADGDLTFSAANLEFLHPGRQAEVLLNAKPVGFVGQLHPAIAQKLKIKQEVYVAQFELQKISHRALPQWQQVSKFPSVRRDLSIVLERQIGWHKVQKCIKDSLGENLSLLQEVVLFDVYMGENIGENHKSLALGMVFREKNRTLEDKEVDNLVSKAVNYLLEQLNAEIRA